MGFRYRKSINLGGGFRINLSKSGIGYSYISEELSTDIRRSVRVHKS